MREIKKILPHENLVYVGDTARVPYGTKSPETIRRYALQISFFLLQKKVKMIVVACNTASALALRALKNLPIPVVGVIEPGARAAVMKTRSSRVGVIGTPATVSSHAYQAAIKKYSPRILVREAACPLFVPLVEAGWAHHSITALVAREYLKPLLKNRVDTLVLGCTHYPLLKGTLQPIAGSRVQLIDSAEETAKEVKQLLLRSGEINNSAKNGSSEYFVTDNVASFSKLSRQFMGQKTPLAKRLRLENI
ncbi:MAG: Glutamate racemase [Elusimicrobia bacterium]|nr:Glutamate racemase [Elusimicrobiota bacterium]